MKHLLLIIFALFVASGAITAKDIKSLRIYLNPGHGSWGPNDRPMATIPYPATMETGRPDTCGFYESNTNLWKTLALGQKLIDNGFEAKNIVHSRLATGPYPYVAGAADEELYNRNLSEICEEVEAGNFDMFLSVHSNAAADGAIANYPLFIFRGYDDGSTSAAGSTEMCQVMWPYLMSNDVDYYTSYSPSNPNIRGDIDFYHSSSTATRSDGKSYTGYLGVLKHGVPGFLSEGYFHTYQPARHRALNQDYCAQEGIRYLRGILDYFNLPKEQVGYIMGTVKDAKNTITHSLYTYAQGSDDRYYPINDAIVTLYKDGLPVDTYQVDNKYNGVFVFSDLEPGDYTIGCEAANYQELLPASNATYKVTANETTYAKLHLTAENGYTPPAPTESTFESSSRTNFAYSLSSSSTAKDFTFTFSSTGDARNANLILTEQSSGETTTIPISDVKSGTNKISIDTSLVDAGTYNWAIQIESEPVKEVRTFFRFTGTSTGSGIAINNNPNNRFFGQIYISDCYANHGIYIVKQDLTSSNKSALFSSQFTGETSSPGRLAINPNTSYVYVADWTDSHSGIFYFSPSSTSILNTFFKGTRESSGRIVSSSAVAVGGSTCGLAFAGTGSTTRLFAFEEDIPTANSNRLCRYDNQTASTWSSAPSSSYSNVSSLMLNHFVNLWGDDNGVWLSQTRSSGHNTADVPALVYMRNNGTIAFNSGNSLPSLSGCNGGGIAVNVRNNLMAVTNGETGIEIYKLTWANNKPTLTRQYTIANSDGAIAQMAFDYADNLYVSARNGNKAYVLPNEKPMVTTPALSVIRVDPPTGIKNLTNSYSDRSIQATIANSLLAITCPAEFKTVRLYSAEGTFIESISLVEGKASFNMSNLSEGVYILSGADKSITFTYHK